MGRKYAIRDQEAIYFVTFTVVNWIDLFVREEYKQITIDSLKYCQENKGLNVHAYCIMTSHIHLILSVNDGGALSDVIRDLKSFTSTKLKNSIRGNDKESRRECLSVDRQGYFGFLKELERRTKETPVFSFGSSIIIRLS